MRPGDDPLQILTQNQLFPTARRDFVQQNGAHQARERPFWIDSSLGSNTTSMKQTELQSTRQTSPRAVSATMFACGGEVSPYAWTLVALLSLGGCFEIYNLALTATLSPGLIRSGIFHEDAR